MNGPSHQSKFDNELYSLGKPPLAPGEKTKSNINNKNKAGEVPALTKGFEPTPKIWWRLRASGIVAGDASPIALQLARCGLKCLSIRLNGEGQMARTWQDSD